MSPIFNVDDYKTALRHEPWKIPTIFFNDIRASIQRIRKGYSYYDVMDMDRWFLAIVPDMLQVLRDCENGSPNLSVSTEDAPVYDGEEWDKILEEMIFLFQEASENTCSKRNPLKEEHEHIWNEFTEKYGEFGEKLMTDEERKDGCDIYRSPSSVPEYKETEDAYYEEARKLDEYREHCKDRAFELFSKWFFGLWY